MATKFAKGQTVKLTAVAPSGPVQAFRLDDDGNIQYLIQWADANGDLNQRWFKEDDLTAE
jgi:hypothetical protein